MAQIKIMNDDFRNMLMNLPEGIVLYNQANHEVVLANSELGKIFKLGDLANED